MTKKKKPEELIPKHLKQSGAPTLYNQEIADRICELVATHDMGYIRIAEKYGLPDRVTVNRWRRSNPEFRAKYAQAKSEQIEFLTEEILEIADNATNDYMEEYDKKEGCLSWRVNGEHIQRSRVRIDTRKWLAAKLVPRMYGDSNTQAPQNNELDEDCKKRYQELDEKNRKEY